MLQAEEEAWVARVASRGVVGHGEREQAEAAAELGAKENALARAQVAERWLAAACGLGCHDKLQRGDALTKAERQKINDVAR